MTRNNYIQIKGEEELYALAINDEYNLYFKYPGSNIHNRITAKKQGNLYFYWSRWKDCLYYTRNKNGKFNTSLNFIKSLKV